MIIGELRNKIDSVWEIFWMGGLTNPLDVIEQMTYLMFIHDLDTAESVREKECIRMGQPYTGVFAGEIRLGARRIDGQRLRWSVFRNMDAQDMYALVSEWVFPFIRNLQGDRQSAYSEYMQDAVFKIPTPGMLLRIVQSMDSIFARMAGELYDDKGDLYEYLLSKLAHSGINGQFRTPRHIIRMMVELMQPKYDDVICDPACGTAGFLVAAGEYLKERNQEIFSDPAKKDHFCSRMFYGYDMDRTMLRISAMNMMTHGVDTPCIAYRNSLSAQNQDRDKFTLILANPPFKGSLDTEAVPQDLQKICKTRKTELLFLVLFLRMLKNGGRCACIVPEGVLFGASAAHKAVRKELVENNRLEAVISLPGGVFRPYTGVSTGILIFTKTGCGGTDRVWFYDMTADGYSLDDRRTPAADNDIPDIITRFQNQEGESCRKRTDKSFLVPKNEIAEHDYILSVKKYKRILYHPEPQPSTRELLAQLHILHGEISADLKDLEEML